MNGEKPRENFEKNPQDEQVEEIEPQLKDEMPEGFVEPKENREEKSELESAKLESRKIEKELSPEEKLGEILKLYYSLSPLMGPSGVIGGTKECTLIGENIGYSSIENSPLCSMQLKFALAASLNTSVKEFSEKIRIQKLSKEEVEQQFNDWTKDKILKGLKILDLGCGRRPTFARLTRMLGADVYTVDLYSADEFNYINKSEIDPKIIEKEIEKHIQLDLKNPNSIEIIKSRTGGDFDLVTEAHLTTVGFNDGEEIGLSLLKRGGIHHDPIINPVVKK